MKTANYIFAVLVLGAAGTLLLAHDGNPAPPFPPRAALVADGNPAPPFPPSRDGNPAPPFPPDVCVA